MHSVCRRPKKRKRINLMRSDIDENGKLHIFASKEHHSSCIEYYDMHVYCIYVCFEATLFFLAHFMTFFGVSLWTQNIMQNQNIRSSKCKQWNANIYLLLCTLKMCKTYTIQLQPRKVGYTVNAFAVVAVKTTTLKKKKLSKQKHFKLLG